jgi:uncharacterized protein (TIGR02996 family)
VTTEDDFHKVLRGRRHEFSALLVFADWLQEHDDPRAEGYRALGRLHRWPLSAPKLFEDPDEYDPKYHGAWYLWARYGTATVGDRFRSVTRARHYTLVEPWYGSGVGAASSPDVSWGGYAWAYFRDPVAAFDVAALSYARAPAHTKRAIEAAHTWRRSWATG